MMTAEKLNAMAPKSIVHARAEIESCRESWQELDRDRAAGKPVVTKQMHLYQMRINFLKNWIKAEEQGKNYPCQHCPALEILYARVKLCGVHPRVLAPVTKILFGEDSRLKAYAKDFARDESKTEAVELIRLFHRRLDEVATPEWRKETGKSDLTYPDLGEILKWILDKAKGVK